MMMVRSRRRSTAASVTSPLSPPGRRSTVTSPLSSGRRSTASSPLSVGTPRTRLNSALTFAQQLVEEDCGSRTRDTTQAALLWQRYKAMSESGRHAEAVPVLQKTLGVLKHQHDKETVDHLLCTLALIETLSELDRFNEAVQQAERAITPAYRLAAALTKPKRVKIKIPQGTEDAGMVFEGNRVVSVVDGSLACAANITPGSLLVTHNDAEVSPSADVVLLEGDTLELDVKATATCSSLCSEEPVNVSDCVAKLLELTGMLYYSKGLRCPAAERLRMVHFSKALTVFRNRIDWIVANCGGPMAPELPTAHLNIGALLCRMGSLAEWKAAGTHFEKAVQITAAVHGAESVEYKQAEEAQAGYLRRYEMRRVFFAACLIQARWKGIRVRQKAKAAVDAQHRAQALFTALQQHFQTVVIKKSAMASFFADSARLALLPEVVDESLWVEWFIHVDPSTADWVESRITPDIPSPPLSPCPYIPSPPLLPSGTHPFVEPVA
eukprot:Sspe_Gene.83571::Locus_54818_Transcript_1_1_Confidence_1.000_Length_1626::g.83571::m.83571